MVRAFGMNPKIRGLNPPQVEAFLSHNFRHFKNIRSCVENECCCPYIVSIPNVNFATNFFYTSRAIIQNIGYQMSGFDSLNG